MLYVIFFYNKCVFFWDFDTIYYCRKVGTPSLLLWVGLLLVLVVHEQGLVFAFGINDDGQLGKPCPLDADGDPREEYRVPMLVEVCRAKVM